MQHLGGVRADQERPEGPLAARRHHDQIDIALFGDPANRIADFARKNNLFAGGLRGLSRSELGQLRRRVGFPLPQRFLPAKLREAGLRRGHDMQQQQPSPEAGGDRCCFAHGKPRLIREIHGNQDGLDGRHDSFLTQ